MNFQKKSHVEQLKISYTSVAIQCQIENELERTNFLTEGKILVESDTNLDITVADNDIYPRAEEFNYSLKKIDDLIHTLSEIQAVYQSKTLKYGDIILNCNNEIGDAENNKSILNFNTKEDYLKLFPGINNLSEEEILKFNINFDENTVIQCHTNRGKHSLKIIQTPDDKNYNPLILHRCESEFLLTKNTEPSCKSQIKNRKSSIELCCHGVNQLQRSYHTLPPRKFNSVLNLSSFKSNIIEHMKNIKDDVKTLRSILYTIECLIKKEDRPNLPFYFEEIKKWFSGKETDIKCSLSGDTSGGDLIKLEGSSYVQAKIRATNFCKFYNLTKLNKDKRNIKKFKKN